MNDAVIGEEIDGYRFLSVIGRGGMGVVYKAEDVNLSRTVAIKRINPSQADQEAFLHRFRAEAQALARIDSPHIVGVHALRETDIGLLIVMEYVEGGTLKDPLQGKEPMLLDQAIPLLEQILLAFHDAHSAGVIHRDIKPQNIMLTQEGTVKVTDFGIAKLRQPDSGETVTQGGQGGTLKYMSPEQISSIDEVDARSDLYSIGMTAYEMLVGRLPFKEGDTDFDIMRKVVEGEIPPPDQFSSDLPSGLAQWIMGAIRTDQEDRYQSAKEMLEALREADTQVDATITQPDWEVEGGQDTLDSTQTVLADTDDDTVLADPTNETVMGPPTAPSEGSPPSSPDDTPGEEEEDGDVLDETESWLPVAGGVVAAVLLFVGGYFAYTQLRGGELSAAELTLTTSPSEALVVVAGDSVGTTPVIDETVQAGGLNVQVRKEGYVPLDTQVTADAGAEVVLRDLQLRQSERAEETATQAAPSTAEATDSSPTESQSDDSEGDAGIEAASQREKTTSPSTTDETDDPTGEASEATSTNTAMATVTIRAEPQGTILIDGEPKEGTGPFELSEGTHEVGCRHPTYGSVERTITVGAGESERHTCYFEQQFRVDTSGPWGFVWINGEQQGSTPTDPISLSPGEHHIELRVESRGDFRVTGGNAKITRGGEERYQEVSGNTYRVQVEPSFTETTHAIVFEVEQE